MSDSTAGESPDLSAGEAGPSDSSYTLFIADYRDVDRAWEAYDALKALDYGRHDEVEGVLVVIRGSNGKLEVHKTRDHGMSGMTWGLAGGAVLGVLFPPAILGAAIVGGGVGAVTDKLRQPHHRKEIEAQADQAIIDTGVLVVGSDPSVAQIREALAEASKIVESAVDAEVAREFKAAAIRADDDG
jgi:hypothetical protein